MARIFTIKKWHYFAIFYSFSFIQSVPHSKDVCELFSLTEVIRIPTPHFCSNKLNLYLLFTRFISVRSTFSRCTQSIEKAQECSSTKSWNACNDFLMAPLTIDRWVYRALNGKKQRMKREREFCWAEFLILYSIHASQLKSISSQINALIWPAFLNKKINNLFNLKWFSWSKTCRYGLIVNVLSAIWTMLNENVSFAQ